MVFAELMSPPEAAEGNDCGAASWFDISLCVALHSHTPHTIKLKAETIMPPVTHGPAPGPGSGGA